jgi:hypothetical protein
MTGLMLAHQGQRKKDDARATLKTLKVYVSSVADPAMESMALTADARRGNLKPLSELYTEFRRPKYKKNNRYLPCISRQKT